MLCVRLRGGMLFASASQATCFRFVCGDVCCHVCPGCFVLCYNFRLAVIRPSALVPRALPSIALPMSYVLLLDDVLPHASSTHACRVLPVSVAPL